MKIILVILSLTVFATMLLVTKICEMVNKRAIEKLEARVSKLEGVKESSLIASTVCNRTKIIDLIYRISSLEKIDRDLKLRDIHEYYRIKSPECGRDKNGEFHCVCGKCEVLQIGNQKGGDKYVGRKNSY